MMDLLFLNHVLTMYFTFQDILFNEFYHENDAKTFVYALCVRIYLLL
jgi:hypothetical protein